MQFLSHLKFSENDTNFTIKLMKILYFTSHYKNIDDSDDFSRCLAALRYSRKSRSFYKIYAHLSSALKRSSQKILARVSGKIFIFSDASNYAGGKSVRTTYRLMCFCAASCLLFPSFSFFYWYLRLGKFTDDLFNS